MKKPKRICIFSSDVEKLRLSAYWFDECFAKWQTTGISVHAYSVEGSIAKPSFSKAARKLLIKEQQDAALEVTIEDISELDLQVQEGDVFFTCTEADFAAIYEKLGYGEEYGGVDFICAVPVVEEDWTLDCVLRAIKDFPEVYGKRCSELYGLRYYTHLWAGFFDGEHDGSRFFTLHNKRIPLLNHVRDEWPAEVVLGDLLSDALIYKIKKILLNNEEDPLIGKRREALYCLVRRNYEKKDLAPGDMTVGALVTTAKELIPQVITAKNKDELDTIIDGYQRNVYFQSVFRTNEEANTIGRRTWF